MASFRGQDIVVTIPKSRLAEVAVEEMEVARRESNGETDLCYYWQMGRLPKLCPERIYFVWDGAIRAYHEVISMVPSQGRIYMKTKIHNIHPIPMKGFRGFRYYDRDRGCVW